MDAVLGRLYGHDRLHLTKNNAVCWQRRVPERLAEVVARMGRIIGAVSSDTQGGS
jgi:hypothetical protein